MTGAAQKSRSETLRTAAAFVLSVILGFALFAALFRLHVLRSIDIVFYRGLVLLVIAGTITFICLIAARSVLDISAATAFSAAVLSMSLNLAFLVTIPVTIDRSITVFMLAEMDREPDAVFTQPQMQEIFIERYIGTWDQIDRRLHEQLLSRNIEQSGDGYKITPQGRSFMRLARWLALLFDTDPRFVDLPPKRAVLKKP